MADDTGTSHPASSNSGSGSAAGGPTRGAMSALIAHTHAGWRAENRGAAQRLTACYEVLLHCIDQGERGIDDEGRPGHALVDSFDVAVNNLLAAMPISAGRAATMLSFAEDLHVRYPAVLAALTEGLLEERIAKLMADQMATVDESLLPLVQQQVVDDYLAGLNNNERPGRNATRDRIDAVINRHDRDAVRQRRQDAARARGVHIKKGRDGMSHLHALLASEEAAVLAEAIEQRLAEHTAADEQARATAVAAAHAAGQPTPTEPEHYPIAQRRADALMSLTCGDASTTGPAGHPTADTDTSTVASTDTPGDSACAPTPLRPRVTVISSHPTSGGRGGVVEFTRTGRAALQALLDMLASSDGATLEQIDARIGAADDAHATLRYRPGAQLARRIRLRDGTCRHPGCHIPADNCDIDHVIPFNHPEPTTGGRTEESNLMCLCRRHHRFKTFADWNHTLEPDGTLIVTSPDGAVMITRPSGPLGEYRREQGHAETAAWHAQQRRSPDPAHTGDEPEQEPTYFTRRAARRHTERARATRANTAKYTNASPGPGRTPTPPGRWWQRNKPAFSKVEHDIRNLLLDAADPPPF